MKIPIFKSGRPLPANETITLQSKVYRSGAAELLKQLCGPKTKTTWWNNQVVS